MSAELPIPDYIPSCRVRLILRFEDYGASDAPKGPAKPPQLRTGKKDEAPLEVRKVDGALLLSSKSAGPQTPGGPQGQLDAPDNRTFTIDILPRTAEVRRNGLREADTASVTLSLADFPFDPRALRAIGIVIFMGTVTPSEYDLGLEGETAGDHSFSGDTNPDRSLASCADTYLDPYGNSRSNKRFAGWVDENTVTLSGDDEPVVSFECVDNTKLLADQMAPPKLTVSATLPIDEAVAAYLANFPQCEGMTVEMRPSNAPRPTLKEALAKSAFKVDLGPPADGSGKQTVLDYLSDVCMSLGLMLWVEETAVVIQHPRTLYAVGASRPSDPYVPRKLPSGRVLERRTLVWGVNLDEVEFTRKMGRTTNQNVEVRCYSEKLKKTIVVRHPPKDQRATSTTPGGATDEKWKVITVDGIESEKALRAIAQSAYEASNRHELGVRIKTIALGSLGGGNEDPDLLDVATGDAIDVIASRGEWAEEDAADEGWSADVAMGSRSDRAASYVRSLGYPSDLADAYGKAVGASAFPNTFRTRTWALSYDAESNGITVSGELMNYVEARLDKALPEGEEPDIDANAPSPVAVTV